MDFLKTRFGAFSTVLILYFLAFLGFFLVHTLTFHGNLLFSTLWGDIAATIIVWLGGILFKNSSLYDPYWSVAPLVIVPFWLLYRQDPLAVPDLLLLLAVFIWGIRLTLNWAVRWSGLKHQDWRYTQLKKQNPRWWFIINLTGIHLMPTIVVFLGLVPVYFHIFNPGEINGTLLWLGFSTCLVAAGLQTVSDKHMDIFRKRAARESYIDEGVWRYSRHPNYFGEILFWWGIWVMQQGVAGLWLTVNGPVVVTLLFTLVSIPLMERHILESKPGYTAYQKTVSVLVPWFRKMPAVPDSRTSAVK